jgi:uncharacterized membrane protein YdbT with pleckstrin-like domain
MASTGVAMAGLGLVVASGITSGSIGRLGTSLASADVSGFIHDAIPFAAETAVVALLAFAAGNPTFHPMAIAVLIGLWAIWAVVSLPPFLQHRKKGSN